MKITKYIILIMTLISLAADAGAQCKQRFVYECALQGAGTVFLKEFNTKFASGNAQRHKVVLTKGYNYTLRLCDPSDSQYSQGHGAKNALAVNSMMTLYDRNNNMLATTNQNSKLTFHCPKTDVYWVHIMPLSPQATCAVGILSVMKR